MSNGSFRIDKSLSFATLGSPPSDPVNGEMYFDGTDVQLRKAGVFSPIGSGGGGSAIVAVYERTTNQSIPNGADTVINFDTMVVDSASAVTTGASWHFTAPSTLNYQMSVSMGFVSNSVGIRYIAFRKNGAAIPCGDTRTALASFATFLNAHCIMPLTAGDTLDCVCLQSSGGALNTDTSFINGITISISSIP